MTQTIKVGANAINLKSQGCTLAANPHTPEEFSESSSNSAVVFSPPFNQVNELTGSVYGRKLAAKGYVVITLDHVGYGNSEGEYRFRAYDPCIP